MALLLKLLYSALHVWVCETWHHSVRCSNIARRLVTTESICYEAHLFLFRLKSGGRSSAFVLSCLFSSFEVVPRHVWKVLSQRWVLSKHPCFCLRVYTASMCVFIHPSTVQLLIDAIIKSANHIAVGQCIISCRYISRASVNVHVKHQNMDNCDLCHFIHGIDVGVWWAGSSP